MSTNHLSRDSQETPWWQYPQLQQQQSTMETATQNCSSSSSSHKVQTTNPQQQFSYWPNSPRPFYHHQLWSNSCNNNDDDVNSNSQNPTLSFNEEREREDQQMTNKNANTNQEHEPEFEKEPMFEKPLTPSDVGKLNRLVIPKQHAEKYFPLGGGGVDSGSDKGLLLNFEDESGKCWRFRYSYWNSSQSYVLTKGWSRYVKEKRLDAGDVILFERHRSDSGRLFIGWRRRGAAAAQDSPTSGAAAGGWSSGLYSSHPYPGVTVPLYQHAGSVAQRQTMSVGNSRTLRLFGVNLECQIDQSEASEVGQGQGQAHPQFNYSMDANNSTNRHTHTDITFSQEDVNQVMRNRQG